MRGQEGGEGGDEEEESEGGGGAVDVDVESVVAGRQAGLVEGDGGGEGREDDEQEEEIANSHGAAGAEFGKDIGLCL